MSKCYGSTAEKRLRREGETRSTQAVHPAAPLLLGGRADNTSCWCDEGQYTSREVTAYHTECVCVCVSLLV